MSYDIYGHLSDEHNCKCPVCDGNNIYFLYRAKDKVGLRCDDCGKRFCVIDAERKIHRAITNADRIRAMSDEELARFIDDILKYNIVSEPDANKCGKCRSVDYAPCWLDWLKSEAKD